MNELSCCDSTSRQKATALSLALNGIDYVNVDYDNDIIKLHLFKAATIAEESIVVDDKVRNIKLPTWIEAGNGTNVILIKFARSHESPLEGRTYRLRLLRVNNHGPTERPLDDFDPRQNEIEFTFNQTISSEVDFLKPTPTVESVIPTPKINYLAKDYASFRRLILDRLATTMPNWRESHAADTGMAIVELMAYVGDRLSYHQDAVATEGYIETARRRESVRRLARLVDYRMHEGHNSRSFVFVETNADAVSNPGDMYFSTAIPASFQIEGNVHSESEIPNEVFSQLVCFEPVSIPPRPWKLETHQIKHPQLFNAIFSDTRGLGDLAARLAELRAESTAEAEVDLGVVVSNANKILEDGIISTQERERVPRPMLGELDLVVRRTRNLPVRDQNRAILDLLLSDYISSSGIDRRIHHYQAHNEIDFYTWDENECWIEKGATSATLVDSWITESQTCGSQEPPRRSALSRLSVGDFLLIEERVGPRTGKIADADDNHRQFVRLTKVRFTHDPAHEKIDSGLHAGKPAVPLVEIEWGIADKLQFPVCISSLSQPSAGCSLIERVSVARGNIIPVDQGRTLQPIEIGTATSTQEQVNCGDRWNDPETVERFDPLQPMIGDARLTFASVVDPLATGSSFIESDPRVASPAITLVGIPGYGRGQTVRLELLHLDETSAFVSRWASLNSAEKRVLEDMLDVEDANDLNRLAGLSAARQRELRESLRESLTWYPQPDLISSNAKDRHFVVENDHQRNAQIRFGDGTHGKRPIAGTQFFAKYRRGNGVRGNVGAGSIVNTIFRRNPRQFTETRNPMPATGGVAPESLRQTKLYAPSNWLTDQPRAILKEDYVRLAMKQFHLELQNAKASIQWVGAYWLVQLAIDPLSSVTDRTDLVERIEAYLNRYRRIGHRVKVHQGFQVPIALGLSICVADGFVLENVRADLIDLFSNRVLPDGKLGFFHPDRVTFGQSIHSSYIIKAAKSIAGVRDVKIDFLHRNDSPPRTQSNMDGQACSSGESQPVATAPELVSSDSSTLDAVSKWKHYIVQLDELEIAQLENNGDPATGYLCLNMGANQ